MNPIDNEEFPKVGILTLNWNGKEDTIECVKTLLGLDYPNYEIVVVDNASSDGSVNEFKKAFPNIDIIENESNLGYAMGFNKGIEYYLDKDIKYIFILNNDTIVDNSALKELIRVAESDVRIGFVSGKVYYFDKPNRLQVVGKELNYRTGVIKNIGQDEIDNGQYDEIKEYKFIDDVFWLVRSEIFRSIGMYDSSYFLQFEETDLCARSNKYYRLMYTPKAKIWHKGSKSGGGLSNPVHTFYLARNRVIFFWRNAKLDQFCTFVIFFTFVKTPISVLYLLTQGNYYSAFAHIKGLFSGFKFVLSLSLKSLYI